MFARCLAAGTGLAFRPSDNYFAALSSQDTAVELSGQLKVLSVSLMKISNDLRWMNSGPLAGLGEIALPALQPGSSIMPGKVNPVVPESVTMIAAQVMGNDATVTVAAASGNFQLNVMLPVIAYNLLQSVELLGIGSRNLADLALAGFTVNRARLEDALARNPILVTALNPVIGYEKGAAIAKKAYAEGRPILEVAAEMTHLSVDELRRLLDPKTLTEGGIHGAGFLGYRWILFIRKHTYANRSIRSLPRPTKTCSGWPVRRPTWCRRCALRSRRGGCRRPCSCRWWRVRRD